MPHNIDFSSEHFDLQPLADGVYAAIASNGGHAICNAGLVDFGEQVLIFDTFVSPQAADDLYRYALQRFNHAPRLVINSHYHNDHIWGNQVFIPHGQIISSARTRQLIITAGKEELDWNSAHSAERLDALKAQYQNEISEQRRYELELWIGEYEAVAQALPHLTVCVPNITFDSRLEIHGTRRSGSLFSFEEAHTGSDTVLHLPQEGVVFMGDLLFVACHPYLGDGDPFKLLQALRALSQLDAIHFVPGHGPVGAKDDVRLLMEYIEGCVDTAQQLVKAGEVSKARIEEITIPEKYQSWQIGMFYRTNISYLCQHLTPAANAENQPSG